MEPERPIEKLLRAFAKKRRDQAGDPMPLHPAMRQQLHKEIARRSARPSGGGWLASLLLHPRLAFAVCFVALGIAALVLLPNRNHPEPARLASVAAPRSEMVRDEKTAPALQAPPVSTVAPQLAGEDKHAFQEKQSVASDSTALKSQPPQIAGANRQPAARPAEMPVQSALPDLTKNPIAQAEPSTGKTVTWAASSNKETLAFKFDDAPATAFGGATVAGAGAVNKDAANSSLASAPPPTVISGVAPGGSLIAANEDLRKKLNLQKQPGTIPASAAHFETTKAELAAAPAASQVFNRLDVPVSRRREVDPLGASAPVLVSFRVEQNGNAMRVVDLDGSVYTGSVQVAQQEGAVRALAPKNAPAPPAKTVSQSQAAQNYFFRVAGTNRNLKQNVVFSGNLIPLTNSPVFNGNAGFGGTAGNRRAQAALPMDSLLSNSRIAGKAVIGNEKEIEVNATPAP